MYVEVKVTEGLAKGRTFTFREPDCFLFGRAADARVSLAADPYVSRQHFLLEISPPECKVTDLDSKNGLFVNGVRYGGRRPSEPGVPRAPEGIKEVRLNNGDEINVGDTVMKIFIRMEEKDAEKPTLLPQTRVYCAHCDRDVTSEIGKSGWDHNEDYICGLCRSREIEDPMDFLRDLLRDAADPGTALDLPKIKGYHIEEEIGRGGMSIVYKAVEEASGRLVAIKTMLPQVAANEENVRMFHREVRITSQLKHKNIVRIYKHGRTENLFFFVMEFVDGTDLEAYIKSKGGWLNIEEAEPIISAILNGLGYAHRVKMKMRLPGGEVRHLTGIVHRDLKPQNILLAQGDKGWIPKIVDFGLSKSFESAGLSNMTIAGQVAGTPLYWPREQITHYKYLTPVTDVFSIAAVFYEALTGLYVREGFEDMFARCQEQRKMPGIADFLRVISANPVIPIQERRGDIPNAVGAVIDQALKETEVPADEEKMRSALAQLRYPNASVFRKKLTEAFRKK